MATETLLEGTITGNTQTKVIDEGTDVTVASGKIGKVHFWLYNDDASTTINVDIVRDVGGAGTTEYRYETVEIPPKSGRRSSEWFPIANADNYDIKSDDASATFNWMAMVRVG